MSKLVPIQYGPDLSWIPSPQEQERINSYYAIQLLQQRLIDGTARAQEVLFCAKMASPREDIERRALEAKIALMEAQQKEHQSNMQILELVEQALSSLSTYRGEDQQHEDVW